MAIGVALAALFLPVLVGMVLTYRGVFPDPAGAIDVLNRTALQVAFPALVVVGMTRAEVVARPMMAVLIVVSLLLSALLVRWLCIWQGQPGRAGTIAVVVVFGNTAYLGLPYIEAVFGPSIVATASMAVAVHVAVAITAGPLLLARWSETDSDAGWHSVRRAAGQPLLWSPFVGFAIRWLDPHVVAIIRSLLQPLASSAAPVSMVLLGIYLWAYRSRTRADLWVWAHVFSRLLLVPFVTITMVLAFRQLGWLNRDELRALVVLAAMPAAITTFSMTLEQGGDSTRVASTILLSTMVAIVTVGLTTWVLIHYT